MSFVIDIDQFHLNIAQVHMVVGTLGTRREEHLHLTHHITEVQVYLCLAGTDTMYAHIHLCMVWVAAQRSCCNLGHAHHEVAGEGRSIVVTVCHLYILCLVGSILHHSGRGGIDSSEEVVLIMAGPVECSGVVPVHRAVGLHLGRCVIGITLINSFAAIEGKHVGACRLLTDTTNRGVDIDDGMYLIRVHIHPLCHGSSEDDAGLLDAHINNVVIASQCLVVRMSTNGLDGIVYLFRSDIVDVVVGIYDSNHGIIICSQLSAGIDHGLLNHGDVSICDAGGSRNEGSLRAVACGLGAGNAYRTFSQRIVVGCIADASQCVGIGQRHRWILLELITSFTDGSLGKAVGCCQVESELAQWMLKDHLLSLVVVALRKLIGSEVVRHDDVATEHILAIGDNIPGQALPLAVVSNRGGSCLTINGYAQHIQALVCVSLIVRIARSIVVPIEHLVLGERQSVDGRAALCSDGRAGGLLADGLRCLSCPSAVHLQSHLRTSLHGIVR